MVSLRIPEDYLLELDQRIGLDGSRNRSDVIREAVRKFISSPLSTINERIEVNLGPDLTIRMKNYCDLHAASPENVLKQGAKEYIRKDTLDGVTIDNIISARMEQVRAHYNNDSNAQ
tara:strand:+ start:160 stop:510 length:351 start_codon:yes stop_codon:yes gene_type:complete